MKKRRILIFVHSFEMGGTQVNLLNTAQGLRGRFDFYFVVFKKTGSTLEKSVRGLVNKFFVLHEKIFVLKRNDRAIANIKKIIEEVRPDVIESHMFYIDHPVREAARLSGVRNVVIYQHGFGEGWGEKEKDIERRYMSLTKKYICVTQWNKKILKSIGIPKKKLVVLYNGINRTVFKNVSPQYSGSFFHIGFVGRLEYSKNPLLLVDIAVDLVAKYEMRNFIIHVAGTGTLETRLKERVRTKNLERFFRFEGEIPRSKIMKLYRRLHLVLLPSKNESLPTAAIEAAMIGLPIVAPKIAGLPELIVNNKTGFLINNPRDYSARLSRLVLDPQAYRKLLASTRRYRRRYVRQFSLKHYLFQRERLWKQMMR